MLGKQELREVINMKKKRVLSGTRATGRLHLGNYLGAVKGYIALQDDPDYETFYMVADLHSINTPYDPKTFQNSVREVVLDYLSAGLDPERSTIFIQSHIPEHIELFYLFSTQVSVARMQHLPTFKEKVKLHPKDVNMALLNYPVLMAADILIYKANIVPVGDDQLPHLEVARGIARKMNNKYGTDFPEPKQFRTEGFSTPSLMGEGKMSKSVEGSYINLTDDLDTIKKKLALAPTDTGRGVKAPETGEVTNLLTFVELFQGKKKRKKYEKSYVGEGIKYKDLKEELAEAVFKQLKPIQEKRRELEKDTEYVDRVIRDGAEKARKVAKGTLKEVKEKMGLVS
jgi:tryptophanyl-tRNA synthetase